MKQIEVQFGDDRLFDEINGRLFDAETELMRWSYRKLRQVYPRPQSRVRQVTTAVETSGQPDRSTSSIAEQFNLLRIADPEHYPAFFELHDQRYTDHH